jgi:hypothetical protein
VRALTIALLLIALCAQAKPGLTLGDLRSFTYDLGESASVEGGKVALVDGQWKDPADGGSSFSLLPLHALGDLDGDGLTDAVGILVESAPGTGSFSYMFALLSRDGGAAQAGPPEWLGDRSVIERLTIDRKGIVTVRYRTHKDGDRECCPTLRIDDRYRLENGVLTGITK